tara:strand:- start:842 stop:2461 length:1620 start_codon:yes stop_codon:yes gene_type:complete
MLAGKLQSAATGIEPVAWNLANAVFQGSQVDVNSFSVTAQDITPEGVFFSSTGLKMYVVGSGNDKVYEYDLSTAWDVATASYLQDFSVATQDTNPRGVFFRADGLKMYVVGATNDSVYEYDLSAAFNISTASYLQNFYVGTQDTTPTDVFFKPDGLKMYVVGGVNGAVYEYNLSVAWNVTTASFLQSKSVAAQETGPHGVFFQPTGLKMYVIGASGDDVNEYNLSTAWSVSTASYLQNFYIGTQDSAPLGIFFKPDGLKMYVIGSANDKVYQYTLSLSWNVTTATYAYGYTDSFPVFPPTNESSPSGVFFRADGLKMYVVGDSGNSVYEFNLSVAWDIDTASYLQNFSVSAQESFPKGIFFKPDGLKMYIAGYGNDSVYEYNLSTAWDISTASFLQTFSVAAQDTNPAGVSFRPDGLKMYVLGYGNDRVYEYNLSTAWNVSTASFVQFFSVGAQDGAPFGFFLRPDGLKMYVVGLINASVFEYDLSTAWDISTASYLQNYSVFTQARNPQSVFFKSDGLQMYVVDQSAPNRSIWAYNFV